MFFANNKDIPSRWEPKRVILYANGIKVYGQIPYTLQKRLRATFVSNEFSVLGGRMVVPTGEANYTIIPRLRPDGKPQRERDIDALEAWLKADAGFEWAVAAEDEFFRPLSDLTKVNCCNRYPDTFLPGEQTANQFRQLLMNAGDTNL